MKVMRRPYCVQGSNQNLTSLPLPGEILIHLSTVSRSARILLKIQEPEKLDLFQRARFRRPDPPFCQGVVTFSHATGATYLPSSVPFHKNALHILSMRLMHSLGRIKAPLQKLERFTVGEGELPSVQWQA